MTSSSADWVFGEARLISSASTIDARAQDAAGQWSNVVSDAATTMARPQPSAQTVKGASGSWGDCSSGSCAYMAVTVKNFPAGNYALRCNDGNSSWGGGSTTWVPANGTVRANCYYGYPGNRVWVTIVGWGNADAMNWY